MARFGGMTLKPYEYRDPGQVVTDVVARRVLHAGDMILALVRDPSAEQKVLRLLTIPTSRRRGLDQYERARLLADYAQRLRVPGRRGADSPWHSIMTVGARRGLAVFGPEEGRWLTAWLFSNHLTGAFSGDFVLVTEHGWADQYTGWGGRQPCLEPR
jgi:diadenosine tetraphosphatase ApaH/serine/threonine PP2A family protein phosphatase